MKRDLFSGVAFDLERFRSDMLRTGARKTYAIYFTPRSGSSWLTDILWQSRHLGRPDEWFNPTFVPKTAQAVNADNLTNYVKMLKRKQAPGGIFGFEITYYQMNATFGGESGYLSFFPPETTAFFLIREDIVLQAVSLAKSVTSSIYHSVNAEPEDINRADTSFEYDARTIRHWLNHILDQESRFEAFFARHGIMPLRLSYERMMAAGPVATAEAVAARVGAASLGMEVGEGRHRKIGTGKNAAFAARFADEQAAYIETVNERRSNTLDALAAASISAESQSHPTGVG